MLRLPYRSTLTALLLVGSVLASACGSSSTQTPLPTEYVQFNYSVTPGTTTGETPMVLTVGAVPMSTDPVCMRTQQKIVLYASAGVAQFTMTLAGATATAANGTNIQAATQTVGTAEIDLEIPTTTDEMGTPSNPAAFNTSTVGNALTCYINLKTADPFATLDGTFNCQSNSTTTGRKLDLNDGQFHALPCPASGG
jgi:hypothetical protein